MAPATMIVIAAGSERTRPTKDKAERTRRTKDGSKRTGPTKEPGAMTKQLQREKPRYAYKTMRSPVGLLTLVATDGGLAAILWEHERAGRVNVELEREDRRHPVLLEAEQQLREYFAGRRTNFTLK